MEALHIFQRGNESEGGFSLIEILFSFFILVTGTLAVLTLLIKSISLNKEEPHRLTALLLADEALSVVHNIRDTNALNGPSPFTGLNQGLYVIGYRYPQDFEPNCTDLTDSAKNIPPKLYTVAGPPPNTKVNWNENIGYFHTHNSMCAGYSKPEFTRSITIINNGTFITVTAKVMWNDGRDQKVELSERLYENTI